MLASIAQINSDRRREIAACAIAACRDAGIDPDSALRRQTAKVVAEAEGRAPQS